VNRAAERPALSKGLLSSFINAFFIAVLAAVFYFGVCYPSMNATPYADAISLRERKNEEYDLNLADNLAYKEYQTPVESFYFDDFPSAILDIYDAHVSVPYSSIAHLYNVNVCGLPSKPSSTDYSTDFFAYVLNEDGTVNVDVKALVKADSLNPTGLSNLADIYRTAYGKLPSLLEETSPEYGAALSLIRQSEGTSRLASIGAAFLLVELAFPSLNKENAPVGEKILRLGYADKSLFRLHRWKLPLRCLLFSAPCLLGAYSLNAYSVALLWVMPLFFNALCLLFGKDNQSIPDKILGIVSFDVEASRIYKDEIEKEDAEWRALASYEDEDYIDLLSRTEKTKDDPGR
jgi:hypothetical protein